MTLAQHLGVKSGDTGSGLAVEVDGDVPDDDIDEDELALLEAQLGQKDEPTSALAASARSGAASGSRCPRGRRGRPTRRHHRHWMRRAGPRLPRGRAPSLRGPAPPDAVTTIEQENTARNKLPTAKGAALVLKLEDAVDRAGSCARRRAGGDGLRAELGGVPPRSSRRPSRSRATSAAADPDVVKSLGKMDKCLKKVRDLRKADGS